MFRRKKHGAFGLSLTGMNSQELIIIIVINDIISYESFVLLRFCFV